MVVFTYVVLVFLVLRFSVTLFNFLSNPKLGKYGKHYSDKVTILIGPTPDTAALLELLNAVRGQDYQHIEVIIAGYKDVVNTKAIAQFCAMDDRFRITSFAGNTLAGLTEEAEGDYFLFLDPHTVIRNGFINSLLYRTKVFNLAVLSVIPVQPVKGLLERCILPLSDFVMLNLVPLRLVRLLSNPAFTAAGDKCMFFDAAIYRTYEWHLRKEIVKAVKMENFKAEVLLGNGLISISSRHHEVNLLDSGGKNLSGNFGNNSIAALIYVTLVVAGPLMILTSYDYALLIMPVGLIILSRIMISFLVRQNPLLNILLHPLQMIMLVVILFNTLFQRISGLMKK
jgi:hypothetical protein